MRNRLAVHATRLLPLVLGIGALALGPGAVAAAAAGSAPSPPGAQPPPLLTILSHSSVGYWAYPQVAAIARATPSAHGRRVARLRFLTPDGLDQAQIYEALSEQRGPAPGADWIDISIPGRPNGKTGWVPASALGPLHTVYGLLVVSRSKERATYYNRLDKPIWSARVGVGRASLPTPAGHYWVLERFRLTDDPFLGPYGVATSAYAPTESEWPGGGVVGIHGTNAPQLIPGRPSHGCVRLRDPDITHLYRYLQLGTQIDIT